MHYKQAEIWNLLMLSTVSKTHISF